MFFRTRAKYNARRINCGGHMFDSMLECSYYNYLLGLKKAGIVKFIELQPKFLLLPAFDKNGVHYRAIYYKADFRVTYFNKDKTPRSKRNEKEYVEIVDVKGFQTQVFKIKRKLFEYKYPNLSLKIINGKEMRDKW